MIEYIKNHPYETVFCVVIVSATICAAYYLGVEYGRSLPNTENIVLKTKVTQLNTDNHELAFTVTKLQDNVSMKQDLVEKTEAKVHELQTIVTELYARNNDLSTSVNSGQTKLTGKNFELCQAYDKLTSNGLELSELNDKYDTLVEKFTTFAKSTKEVSQYSYDVMITALKNIDRLNTNDLPEQEYVVTLNAIHDTLSLGAAKLLPLIEPIITIVS
jgi:chromosome segregation ATPase